VATGDEDREQRGVEAIDIVGVEDRRSARAGSASARPFAEIDGAFVARSGYDPD
jgi:hypothetical protein